MPEPKQFDGLDSFRSEANHPIHLAIGMFDGVHQGHRIVVESAIRSAVNSGGLAGVLTFWPHPSHLFKPDNPVPMILNSRMKRSELIKLRIDFVIEEPFSPEFAAVDSVDFLALLKCKIPTLASMHTGENWRFGKGRQGDVKLLVKLAEEAGISAESLECLFLDGERVSSTRIRNALIGGRVEEANRLLGYTYETWGTVREGKRVGRTIGVPTLNIPFDGELTPKLGVYNVNISREGGEERLPAVANFGIRPTVNSLKKPMLEVHVLGDCPFSYGDSLRVEWLSFLRRERKYECIDKLKTQIQADISDAKLFFESP